MSVGDASFRELAVGSLWTGVVDVSDDCSFALWINEPVRVQADLTTGVHTIYGFVFAGFQGGLAVLEASDTSKWFKAKHCHSRSFRNIVDACCGLGGFFLGPMGVAWQHHLVGGSLPARRRHSAGQRRHGFDWGHR